MDPIHLQLLTPERTLLDEQVSSITCPTPDGQIMILQNHEALVSVLAAGVLQVVTDGHASVMAMSGGVVEVRPGNHVVILADSAEHAHEIDEQKAYEALTRAAEDMKLHKPTEAAFAVARSVHAYQSVRLDLARKRVRPENPISSDGIFKE